MIWEENTDNGTKREKAIKRFKFPPEAEAKTSAPFVISQSETRKGNKREELKKKKKNLLKSLNQTLTFNSINAKYANVHPTDHYGIKN